ISISVNLLIFNFVDVLIARLAMKSGWLSRYGASRFAKLQADLLKTRERAEAKEAARSLKARELVKNFPLFSELDSEQLQEILFLFRPRFASPGERLIRRGDWGDVMFFIVSGAVEVAVGGEKLRLGAGEMFGEMALLGRTRRTAD